MNIPPEHILHLRKIAGGTNDKLSTVDVSRYLDEIVKESAKMLGFNLSDRGRAWLVNMLCSFLREDELSLLARGETIAEEVIDILNTPRQQISRMVGVGNKSLMVAGQWGHVTQIFRTTNPMDRDAANDPQAIYFGSMAKSSYQLAGRRLSSKGFTGSPQTHGSTILLDSYAAHPGAQELDPIFYYKLARAVPGMIALIRFLSNLFYNENMAVHQVVQTRAKTDAIVPGVIDTFTN